MLNTFLGRYAFFELALISALLGLRAWVQQRRLRARSRYDLERLQLRGEAGAGLGCGITFLLAALLFGDLEGSWLVAPSDAFDWAEVVLTALAVGYLLLGLGRNLLRLRRATGRLPTGD